MKRLEGKVCVVTGGGGSLGVASAELMLREGARVFLVDRDEGALEAVRAQLGDGGRVAVWRADVAESDETRAYIAAVTRLWGKIDIVFSNAGISGAICPITDYPEETFDAVMAVDVRASFLACKYALPHMNDGGSIIMNASVVGVTSDPGICAYAASKHALIGLMRTVAKETAARRIRVNVVAPGPIDNSFQQNVERNLSAVVGRDATQMLDRMIPLGRHGTAAEIAQAVVFLACGDSSFSTGGVFMADGGMHI